MMYATDIIIILLKIGCQYIPLYCNVSYSNFVYDKELNRSAIFDKIWLILTKP